MNEIRENIAENALGGAARGPLPFKRWLLNREHRLKLKEEEMPKKEQMNRPNIKNLLKYYYVIGMGSFGFHWWKSNRL